MAQQLSKKYLQVLWKWQRDDGKMQRYDAACQSLLEESYQNNKLTVGYTLLRALMTRTKSIIHDVITHLRCRYQ